MIENGQALIGGIDLFVCRNYFGRQISSFEMSIPPPPGLEEGGDYPGVFIRAPSIFTVGKGIEVLGKVVATPSRQALVVLRELERKIEARGNVTVMGVVDALERKSDQDIKYVDVKRESGADAKSTSISLPGAADGTNAREVICAARKNQVLVITSFHPELTRDTRWHQYIYKMVVESISNK